MLLLGVLHRQAAAAERQDRNDPTRQNHKAAILKDRAWLQKPYNGNLEPDGSCWQVANSSPDARLLTAVM